MKVVGGPIIIPKGVFALMNSIYQDGQNVNLGSSPRICNTGAQNTPESSLKSLVDWVSVTLKSVDVETLVTEILSLSMDEFVELDKGNFGYTKTLICGNIRIFFEGRKDMGIHLQMSGQGCREYEGYKKRSWQVLFCLLLDLGGKFSRLDVSVDDFKGFFKLKELEKRVKKGLCVSKFNDATNYEKIRLKDGYVKGQTLYFGSGSSRINIRFYDKLAQKLDAGCSEEVEGLNFWNRTEIELKDERAQKVAWMIAEDVEIGKVVCGVLKHYIRFVDPGKSKNKSRWKTARFWDKFLGDVEALKLTDQPKERTIEDKINWVSRQVSRTLALLYWAEDEQFVWNFFEEGEAKFRESDLEMLKAYWREREDEPGVKYKLERLEEYLSNKKAG